LLRADRLQAAGRFKIKSFWKARSARKGDEKSTDCAALVKESFGKPGFPSPASQDCGEKAVKAELLSCRFYGRIFEQPDWAGTTGFRHMMLNSHAPREVREYLSGKRFQLRSYGMKPTLRSWLDHRGDLLNTSVLRLFESRCFAFWSSPEPIWH
jgi:hypothetical protein